MPVEALTVSVEFNHTIVLSRDREKSAHFLASILGLEVGEPAGMFLPVTTANGVTLDFAGVDIEIPAQHYAFLVSEDEFDGILARLVESGTPIQADPPGRHPAGSTATTAAGACTSPTRPGTAWRPSPARTAATRPRR